jgi:hypothetical protein
MHMRAIDFLHNCRLPYWQKARSSPQTATAARTDNSLDSIGRYIEVADLEDNLLETDPSPELKI